MHYSCTCSVWVKSQTYKVSFHTCILSKWCLELPAIPNRVVYISFQFYGSFIAIMLCTMYVCTEQPVLLRVLQLAVDFPFSTIIYTFNVVTAEYLCTHFLQSYLSPPFTGRQVCLPYPAAHRLACLAVLSVASWLPHRKVCTCACAFLTWKKFTLARFSVELQNCLGWHCACT